MLLISTTHKPATDLGFLLHKNPGRDHTSETTFGRVHVVYPESREEKATVALILEIDTVKLVRRKGDAQGSLANYINDRAYVASSFLSVAIADMFGTAMGGRSKERPELAKTPIPLEIRVPVLACRAGVERLERLFQPLGYHVEATGGLLDPEFPEWGQSPYFDVTLTATVTVRDALRHLYLLLPVLDSKKHYYLDKQEVDKMVSKGQGWLPQHPEKEWIVRASLGRKPSMVREALEQLSGAEEDLETESNEVDEAFVGPDIAQEEPRKVSLHKVRHEKVMEIVRDLSPKSVVDLGCGDGPLIRQLLKVKGIDKILGMDVSYFELEKANRKLRLEDAGPRIKERVQLIHGSLMYKDSRIEGFDLCTVVEVVEHLDPPRLSAFEKVVFGHARPKYVVLTTPNREYNAVYEVEGMRHQDHRFEWTRAEFQEWVDKVCERFGYTARVEGIGDSDPALGQPSQMAVFSR